MLRCISTFHLQNKNETEIKATQSLCFEQSEKNFPTHKKTLEDDYQERVRKIMERNEADLQRRTGSYQPQQTPTPISSVPSQPPSNNGMVDRSR